MEQTSFKKHHKFVKQRGSRWDSSLYLLHVSSYACAEAFIIFCVTHCSSPSNGLPKSYVGIIFFFKYFCFPQAHFCVHSQCTLFFIRDHKMYCERERKLLKRPPGSIFSFLKVLDQSFFPFQSVPDTLCVLDFVNVTCQISPKTKNKNVS